MGMFINTNVNALNTSRNLSMNNTALGKTAEKLSSGYRINRAADDAAGLAHNMGKEPESLLGDLNLGGAGKDPVASVVDDERWHVDLGRRRGKDRRGD